jgi:tetratricopeptide (TPR) repeat protein
MRILHGRRPRATRRRARPLGSHPALRLSGSLTLTVVLLLLGVVVAAAARSDTPIVPPVRGETAVAEAQPGPAVATTISKRISSGPASVPPPADLLDLPSWLDYRARNHLAGLPLEARLFYRRGLMLAQAGNREEAVRMVRGAAELDPAFVAPHLTLASWLLMREPSQALLQYASVIELSRQNFMLQLALAGNLLYLGFQSLFIGLLAAALILIGLRNRELRHAWQERLARFVSPASARTWSWALLVLPFACGFGLVLPTVVFLGLLWTSLKTSERAVFIGLVAVVFAAPWVVGSLDRLAIPLRETHPPFYGVPLMGTESPSEERRQELAGLARRRPENPFLQFAAAWAARRHGDLAAAEAGYRRTLQLWPDDDRVLTNLGNVLAMQGHTDEALTSYRRAGARNPANAAAAFNASQIYTQRFDYHAATDALSRAAALNFDLVKTYQSQATDDGVLPLVDQWIAPRSFWAALSVQQNDSPGRGALPPAWRSRIEFSGWVFSVVAAALALLASVLGVRANRAVPLRVCSNCGAIVCRRCACRRRETALCPDCAAAEARAETPDFARVLLHQHRRRVHRVQRLARTALATLIPGFGLLAFRRVMVAVVLLSVCAGLVAVGAGLAAPYSYEIGLALPDQEVPLALLVGMWLAVYAISILRYLAEVLRADAEEASQAQPVRSRIRLSGRDRSVLAA